MRHTRARKDRKFLSSDKSIKSVYCGNARLYKFVRILSCRRVYRSAVYIERFFRDYLSPSVDDLTHSVEYSAEHIAGNSEFNAVTRKSYFAL